MSEETGEYENVVPVDRPLVSIIVPVYNIERYVDDCVRSIVSQKYKNFEVLLIDDGSSDESSSLCDQWVAKDKRVRAIHQANAGLSVARNVGIENARGDIFIFVDGDDVVDASLVSRVVDEMKGGQVSIVGYEYDLIDEAGGRIGLPQRRSMARKPETITGERALSAIFAGRMPHFAWKYAVDANLFSNVHASVIRYPIGRKLEDVATTYRLFSTTQMVRRIPEILYHYRQREGSILHGPGILWSDWLVIFDEMRNNLTPSDRGWALRVERWALTVGINLAFGLRNDPKSQLPEYRSVLAWTSDRLNFRSFFHLPWRQKVKVIVIWPQLSRQERDDALRQDSVVR